MVTVKEFRIAMPMKVEEYQRAQLYMIMKKSKEESEGEDSGVQIIRNEPYTDGPGGCGQYTEKIYYVQKHLPSMVKAVLPKDSLTVKECSWNAYPYTKTVFTTPALDKFNIDIETKFLSDPGISENVFNLSPDERENIQIDVLDMCREKTGGKKEEDPTEYISKTTKRGPLPENWLEETQQKDKDNWGDVMCSYKLVKVEFKYWGIQRKMENWILDLALRKTILKGHQQAWTWQDEWFNLTMEDIRLLEKETQQKLAQKFMNTSPDDVCASYDLPEQNYEQVESDDSDEFFDAMSRMSEATMTNRRGSDVTFHSTYASDEFCDSADGSGNQETPPEIANLIIVVHTANILGYDANAIDDVQVFRGTIQAVLKSQFPTINPTMVHVEEITLSHVNEQLVRGAKSCAVNTTISPQIPLLAASDKKWSDAVDELQVNIESIVNRFARRRKFDGQVYLVGDVLGGLVCYDLINRLYEPIGLSKRSSLDKPTNAFTRSPSIRSQASSTGSFEYGIEFSGLLLFNCPLAYLILQRKFSGVNVHPIHVPIFNLFYPIDQNAARLEPIFMQDECPNEPLLLCRRDLSKPLFNVSREYNSAASTPTARRRRQVTGSLRSFFSRTSKKSSFDTPASSPDTSRQKSSRSEQESEVVFHDNRTTRRCHSSTGTVLSISDFSSIDTGCPRIDYMLSCPEGLATMSSKCLPQYLYAAFWESADAASLLLKQAIYVESNSHASQANDEDILNPKTSTRWQRRRTTIKVRNLEPNHRAQDCLITEGSPAVITGRFSYGFFDVAMLTGETIELQIRSDISENGWETVDSKDTDSSGRVSFTLPSERYKSVGLYHFRLTVTGDNSSCSCSLAIVPSKSKCVVFSIDSSFAGSVSILGTDPKVRPASVDVARFWNDNDYFILYISSRPDMMKNRVVSWLKQHNFPNGFTFFQRGIHHDPYAKKCEMLKKLISSSELDVAAAYGGPKDLQIYRSINIPTRSIFVVGSKGKNKIQNMGTVLSEGYNVHLDWLRNSQFQMAQSNAASRLILKRQATSFN